MIITTWQLVIETASHKSKQTNVRIVMRKADVYGEKVSQFSKAARCGRKAINRLPLRHRQDDPRLEKFDNSIGSVSFSAASQKGGPRSRGPFSFHQRSIGWVTGDAGTKKRERVRDEGGRARPSVRPSVRVAFVRPFVRSWPRPLSTNGAEQDFTTFMYGVWITNLSNSHVDIKEDNINTTSIHRLQNLNVLLMRPPSSSHSAESIPLHRCRDSDGHQAQLFLWPTKLDDLRRSTGGVSARYEEHPLILLSNLQFLLLRFLPADEMCAPFRTSFWSPVQP